MKKNKTTIIFIVSILSAIIIATLFFFALNIIKNKNKHISATLSTLNEKIKEKEEAYLFADKISETKSIQDTINNYFVDKDNIDSFVGYIEEIGGALGSKVIIKSIDAPAKSQNIINFKISISGTFESVARTIALLENIPYQVNIINIYLNKDISPEDTNIDTLKNNPSPNKLSTWQAEVTFNILSSE